MLWGGNAVAAKLIVSQLPPMVTILVRFIGMSLVILCMAFWLEGKKAMPARRHFLGLAAMGLTGTVLNNGLYFSGFLYSTAVNCVLLSAVGPSMTATLMFLFFRERLSMHQWIGIAVSALGVVILVSGGSLEVLLTLSFNRGDILFLLSYLTWSCYSILARPLLRELSAMATTGWAGLLGTIFVIPFAVASGLESLANFSTIGWLSMAYMILGSGALAFWGWNRGVSAVGPSRAAVFINIIPITGMFFAVILLNESVTWVHLIGAAWIIAGVFLTTRQGGQS